MTYAELIAQYPCIDLCLELFKGLAPTIVAVLAIIINNSIASKRDKQNAVRNTTRKICEAKVTILNTMLDKYIELSQLFWVCGTHLILYLSYIGDKRSDKEFESFENTLYQFQFKAQEIYDYYSSMMKQYEFCIGCNATLTDTNAFAEDLSRIAEKYIDILENKTGNQKEVILDGARDEILEATTEVKAWTNVIMVDISKEIKRLYEE